jgi:hypothetical protein
MHEVDSSRVMSRLCQRRFPKIAGAAISADMTIRSYGTYQ